MDASIMSLSSALFLLNPHHGIVLITDDLVCPAPVGLTAEQPGVVQHRLAVLCSDLLHLPFDCLVNSHQ